MCGHNKRKLLGDRHLASAVETRLCFACIKSLEIAWQINIEMDHTEKGCGDERWWNWPRTVYSVEQKSWFVSYMTDTRKLLNTVMSWIC